VSTEPRVYGIVPAAGRGRRVAGLRWRKDLYPIGWEEVLVDGVPCQRPRVVGAYLLDGMVAAGAERLFLVVGESGDVMRHFGPEHGGVPIAYLYQEELRGGAFAIDLARPWLAPAHTILFGFPDTIVEPPDAFSHLLADHRQAGADLTLGLFPTDRPSAFGMVRLAGDRPVELIDKPAETDLRLMWGLAAWGPRVTALQPALLADAPAGREAVPGDIFNAAIAAGLRVGAHIFEDGRYLDVGTPAELNRAVRRYGLEVARR
jgi:glucose-1-phosphate thymidylyltransferase